MSIEGILEHFRQEAGRLCGDAPGLLRSEKPLVHLLTNYVTVTDCVNALLAAGARGICSHAPEEAAEVCAGSDALVCNLGGTEYYAAMDAAAREALRRGIPLLIDPVGCAASAHRREKCLQLIRDFCPAAVRGNYAEITALLENHAEGSGLDCIETSDASGRETLLCHMRDFARANSLLLIASGAVDLCTDGTDQAQVCRGTPALRRITGAGCMSSALLGAFLAVKPGIAGAVCALNYTALAGEAAAEACRETGTGAGHFHMFFMDALSAFEPV